MNPPKYKRGKYQKYPQISPLIAHLGFIHPTGYRVGRTWKVEWIFLSLQVSQNMNTFTILWLNHTTKHIIII